MSGTCQTIAPTQKTDSNKLPRSYGPCYFVWKPTGPIGGEWTTQQTVPDSFYPLEDKMKVNMIDRNSHVVQHRFTVKYPYFLVASEDPNHATVFKWFPNGPPSAAAPPVVPAQPIVQPVQEPVTTSSTNLTDTDLYRRRFQTVATQAARASRKVWTRENTEQVKELARAFEAKLRQQKAKEAKERMTVSERLLGNSGIMYSLDKKRIVQLKDVQPTRSSVPRPPRGFSYAMSSTLTTPQQARALEVVDSVLSTLEEMNVVENPMHTRETCETILIVRSHHKRSYKVQLMCFVTMIASIVSVLLFGLVAMAFSNTTITTTLSDARSVAAAQGSLGLMNEYAMELDEVIQNDPNLWEKSDADVLQTMRETWCPALQNVLWGLSVFERESFGGSDKNFYSMLATICSSDVSEKEAANLARDISAGFNCVLYNQYEGAFGLRDACPAKAFVQSAVDASNHIVQAGELASVSKLDMAMSVGAMLLLSAGGLMFGVTPPLPNMFGRQKKNKSRHRSHRRNM